MSFLLFLSLALVSTDAAAAFCSAACVRTRATSVTESSSLFGVQKPFGEQQYWESWYQNRSSTTTIEDDNSSDEDRGDFSWYASWEDIRPLFHEFFPENDIDVAKPRKVLLPGIGIDAALAIDMHQQDGYMQLSAMDYAPASITHVQKRWDESLLQRGSLSSSQPQPLLDLCVADVRHLPYATGEFDAVLDKGTLDAVYLCGETPQEKRDNLYKGAQELQRVLKPRGGLFWSLSGICAEALVKQKDVLWPKSEWERLVDTTGDSKLYTTQDGYTSNNVDGALLVFRKK